MAALLESQLAARADPEGGSSGEGGPGLRVHLAFPAAADLDLYVTDPLQETVYYANTPTRSGGVLREDRRCIHPAPRLETVEFERPPAGRYRVGVDYAGSCLGDAEVVPFVIAVDSPSGREWSRGLARPAVFEPIVLEVAIVSGDVFEGEAKRAE